MLHVHPAEVACPVPLILNVVTLVLKSYEQLPDGLGSPVNPNTSEIADRLGES